MTLTPRGVSARQFVRALQADGFVLQRVRGSHRIYRRADSRRVVVAYHQLGDTFPVGTLRAMIVDAGWDSSSRAEGASSRVYSETLGAVVSSTGLRGRLRAPEPI